MRPVVCELAAWARCRSTSVAYSELALLGVRRRLPFVYNTTIRLRSVALSIEEARANSPNISLAGKFDDEGF